MTNPASSDEGLLDRCRAGEEDAWAEVWRIVLGQCRAPRWRLGDRAPDLASVVVNELLSGGIDRVREPRAFRSYLRRLTASRILDELRRPVHRFEISEDLQTTRAESSEAVSSFDVEDIQRRLDVNVIWNAIRDLGNPCQQVLEVYLAYKVGLVDGYREMEEILQSTTGTISKQVARCLGRLRKDPRIQRIAGADTLGGEPA